ncbi:cyclic nucleotide-binding domain-containing protein [Streptomyces sp. NBC_00264]|uniref:cyclic nucleotide-binding domain-containing protein n=1 Tax=unclassified Streptomyces TaxID=2593676 RepID=UPI000F5BDD45|nr:MULTISPECIES: cyclic nucleotide-binding domain-containing protein [unclassified Streptomyces]WSG55438.1 cyclic nucleotide-binding domain-containing protein [Streptomyces sp. NBC_01732]WSX06575.1 cyclic nucleotide-binding domain-containing protein [Streptomyces sp. NBC_00987]MCX4391555.1 cyclic nucleotide-binding domain-containing protein [Streptomyces sp. NBC_01767]MCX5098258.1 cyclic nucleotide-binding domain-containing protein [Streptomyces sp. NBC_00439]MCX5165271.1 cyclic nucleotide-bin
MSGSPTRITAALPARYRARLMGVGQEVNFAQGVRLFQEGDHADRFWILRSGTVTLDIRVPGSAPVVIDSLGSGELVGWAWLFEPHIWHLGAEAMTPVRTHEFDATAVRMMMDADPAFGSAIGHWVGQVLAHRLQATRIRLLDLYAPHGSGGFV